MAKKTSDASTDAALNYIKDNVETMYLCSAEPADYAGISAVSLADVAVGSADVTVGAGTGGREYEVAQKSGITIDSSGDVTHIVLAKDSATSELLDITTCTSTAVSTGGSATVNSWTRTIQDPT
jgi:hypothetical protein